ncbi:HIT family protein [Paludisphaera mucosa]|uniref:HIT family protein n=1 Tax=Paludisphaera mucosa TaxID=3030827 RepID=A0ABT6FI15_9BACT|nr:HIT family protein [Paludisphaera mucosa]MDG3007189.1 HIT family protein [Paludisphaera mucosa]
MSRDPNCLFCKIVHGEIPSARVLETDRAIVILDVNPVARGHVLVVPRDHHPQLRDLPDELAAHAGSLLPRLTRAVVAATGADGSNLIVNSGRVAGQTIDHCHWHVIPRFENDPVDWPWPHEAYAGDEMGRMASQITRELGGDADG